MSSDWAITHLLDMETARGGRRFPEREYPAALCGAAEMGPVDLSAYGGVITCEECRAFDATRPVPILRP